MGNTAAELPWMLLVPILAGLGTAAGSPTARPADPPAAVEPAVVGKLFARDNLIAWCIVPFDSKKRSPEDRAAMLERLGLRHFAYDWRAEHVPTFDAEVDALNRHRVALDTFWLAPGELNAVSRRVLDLLKRHHVKAQLWVLLDFGADKLTGAEQDKRVAAAAEMLRPPAEEAGKIGCSVGLYNHGGWFGEPENQLAILERLKAQGVTSAGIVYNLHHGHDHLDRLAAVLEKLKPHLFAVNLNGSDKGGDKVGRQILAQGDGRFTLDDSGRAFANGFQIKGGRGGPWNGWRPEPKAEAGDPAKFSGLWLTGQGLMELEQSGNDVKGRYAFRGTSSIGITARRSTAPRSNGFRRRSDRAVYARFLRDPSESKFFASSSRVARSQSRCWAPVESAGHRRSSMPDKESRHEQTSRAGNHGAPFDPRRRVALGRGRRPAERRLDRRRRPRMG